MLVAVAMDAEVDVKDVLEDAQEGVKGAAALYVAIAVQDVLELVVVDVKDVPADVIVTVVQLAVDVPVVVPIYVKVLVYLHALEDALEDVFKHVQQNALLDVMELVRSLVL